MKLNPFVRRLALSAALGVLAACSSGEVSDDPVTPDSEATSLQRAVAEENLSGTEGSQQRFTLAVGSNAVDLTFDTTGGSGDVALYVRRGAEPTTADYDCASATPADTMESCEFSSPTAGTYHVMIHGDTAYSGVQLIADYDELTDDPVDDPGDDPVDDPVGGTCTYSATQLALLEAHNQARAQARSCGTYGDFPAVAPLTLNCQLTEAAIVYSTDMRDNDAWNHIGSDGSTLGDRLRDAGYDYRSAGENIAKGYRDVEAVMNGWLDSDGHCANIMRSGYTEMGAGILDEGSYPYWTVDFGRPR